MTPEQRRLCIEVLGWNQTQFARFIDRDPATVRRWFTGAREPESEVDDWLYARALNMASNPPPGCDLAQAHKRLVALYSVGDLAIRHSPIFRLFFADETDPKLDPSDFVDLMTQSLDEIRSAPNAPILGKPPCSD